MRMVLTALLLTVVSLSGPAAAQEALEGYVARLGERDHFNSKGQRLTSAAAIIRQDRANFHKFGVRDPEDESDSFFADKSNRDLMERLLERGHATGDTLSRIVNGTPLIHVRIYNNYVDVTVD